VRRDFLDAQPLSRAIPAEIRRRTELLIECRADPVLFKLVENLALGRVAERADAFVEPVVID
jgi:hypothetical protein